MTWSEKYKESIDCGKPKGFSQRAHCQGRKKRSMVGKATHAKTPKKKQTYFKKYDLYSDANPKDTVKINYVTVKEVRDTIKKLEKLYKSGSKPHRRIVQITNVMTQRLRVINEKTGKGGNRYKISKRYFDFLKSRTKVKGEEKRKSMNFK
jgi:hypothetical protein|tara:strand:+ start:90 stop:539 length:450 start_codon:yes stop_codon:yes gene_type:complete